MKIQTVAKLRLGGRDFAVVPWVQYQRLAAPGKAKSPRRKRSSIQNAAEDRRDAQQVQQVVQRYRAGKLVTISHESLKRSLGL